MTDFSDVQVNQKNVKDVLQILTNYFYCLLTRLKLLWSFLLITQYTLVAVLTPLFD